MSLRESDLIHLPYDDSLTLTGITYATRSLQHGHHRAKSPSPHFIRRVVATIAAELAFRRWLEAEGVPYTLFDATPFTQPDHPCLAIGGRRIEVRNTFITSRHLIRRLRRAPSWLLETLALVPVDLLDNEYLGEGDLFVFIHLAGLETRTQSDLNRAFAADQKAFLIAIPPTLTWRRGSNRHGLGKLVLKSDTHYITEIELGVIREDLCFTTERVTLRPLQPTATASEPNSLLYLHATNPPSANLDVYSPTLNETWEIKKNAWANIWIYGLNIVLTGWSTKGVFRRNAHLLPVGNRTQLIRRTQVDNRSLPVSQLRSMHDLVERMRQV